MSDPYAGITAAERQLVDRIARAMGNGMLGPNNKQYPLMARRVFDDLRASGVLLAA